jgi:N-acetylglucosaminyldiphosphoundecaprenol N-acetyl-beta-D-mannosaminyltransferase
MIDFGKQNILGVGINAVDYELVVKRVLECAKDGLSCPTTALAVHGLVTGALDAVHRTRLNQFTLAVPDGQPVRWALRLLYGLRLSDRVYGPKLSLLLCKEAAKVGVPVYFYGSRDVVIQGLRERLRELCPGLEIAGAEASAFRALTSEEQESLVSRIRASKAQILFVGLGCPRQEVFAYEMSERLKMPILAVGAAFDYFAGVLREPPELIQKAGLQWLYRMLQEPHRLWKRYLFTNTQFLVYLFLQWAHLWRPKLGTPNLKPPELRYG